MYINTLSLPQELRVVIQSSVNSRALSRASNITVTYPKLKQIQVQVHNQQQETTHGSV